MFNMVKASVNQLNLNTSIEMNDSTIGIDFWADVFRLMAKRLGKNFKINDESIQYDPVVSLTQHSRLLYKVSVTIS